MGARISTHDPKKRHSSKYKTKSSPSSNNSSSVQTHLNEDSSNSKTRSFSSQSSESIFRLGRKFHNESNSSYWLPNDDEEMDRLVGQHFALKALFGGNIPEVVIQDKNIPLNTGATILDLGCGPGTWIMDVATEYPTSEFIGVDMCDVFPNNIRPANVQFQICNLLEGLPFPDNTFDIVNFSFFIVAFKSEEWLNILKEIKRVLKPGGYILSREPGMLEVGNDFVKWAGRIFIEKMLERGQEPYIADKMKDNMALAGFKVIQHIKKETFPGRPDQISKDFQWDIQHIFKSCQPFLEKDLKVPTEKYGQFLKDLATNLQAQPESQWPMTVTIGQKDLSS